ncbi:SAM-dependent methyltransferase [Candidatus Methanophagaceae archaeon]|nr:SAM-dependent methyltransferase [Methanophagales archaeon]
MSTVKEEYDKNYFENTAEDTGLLLKERRPLWRRWLKIIQTYKATGKLLDVGCGPGFFLEYAERNYEVYGIDISEYAVRAAKQRTQTAKLAVGDATDLDYKNDYFDIVTCFDLLEHLPEPEFAVQEFHRILKRDGILVLRVPNTDSIGAKMKNEDWFGRRDKTHVSLLSNEEWLNLLKCNSFEITEVFFDGLWDTPYFKRVPKVLQDVFIKLPSLILFLLGMKYKKCGENVCMIGYKR